MDESTLLADVERATPVLRDRRGGAEDKVEMDPTVLDLLAPTGVFRMDAPEAPVAPGVRTRVYEELAHADPSVAWAAMNSTGASAMTRFLDAPTRAEVLDPGNRFFGIGLTPTGRADRLSDHTFRVSGSWPVVSGSTHASLFALHCVVHDGDGSPIGLAFCFVPADAAEIDLTWQDVIAVRGSGSHAVRVDAVDIPAARMANILGEAVVTSPWAALSGFGTQSLAIGAVATGIARRACDAAIDQARDRVSAMSGAAWKDLPSVQATIASADVTVFGLRAGLFALADEIEAELRAGAPSDRSRARAHTMADHCVATARQTVSDLFTTGSVDALRRGHVLEQSLRDIHAFGVQWERYRRYHYEAGRVLMGAEITDPLF